MNLYFEVGSVVSHAILGTASLIYGNNMDTLQLESIQFFLTEPAKMVWGFYNGSLSYFITFPKALQFYVKCV